jgi:lysophospholipase L1-like esterase
MSARYTAQASSITVTNAGRSGEHPHEGVQRFSDALAATRPEVVLLLEGANSLWLYGSDLPTLGVGNMVDAAQAAGVRVLVATLPPSLPGMHNSLPQVELLAYNRKITEMAAIKGIGVVNLYDPMLAEAATLIGSDGLHPTEAGYRRMAELFFAAIRNDLEVR